MYRFTSSLRGFIVVSLKVLLIIQYTKYHSDYVNSLNAYVLTYHIENMLRKLITRINRVIYRNV